MLGVDDGIVNGNYDFADLLFLLACIVAALAAVLCARPNSKLPSCVFGWIAVALLALGWFVL